MDKSSAYLKVRGFLAVSIMNNITFKSAAEARKNWSQLLDEVARKKPQFVRCAKDDVMISDVRLLKDLLEIYTFTATKFIEEDNSITLSLNELDIVENGSTEEEAKSKLAMEIVNYSKEFYEEF